MNYPRVGTLVRFLLFLSLLASGASAAAVTIPPARSFVRTDMPPEATVFDPVHKVVYVSVPGMNQVDVISTATHTITARIPVPRAFGMDISPDGTQLVVGSGSHFFDDYSSQYLTLIDTATLKITNRVLLPQVLGLSGVGLAPTNPVWTSNGTVLVIVHDPHTTYFDLVQWDPANNSFRYRFNQISGYSSTATRSGDYSKVLIQTSDNHLCLYDAASDSFVANVASVEGLVAANFDGTQFAVTSGTSLIFLNASLGTVSTLLIDSPYGNRPYFTRDGKSLYVPQYTTQHFGSGAYFVYDTTSFQLKGEMPAFHASTGFDSMAGIDGVDDQGEFFGALDRGVAFYNFPVVNSPTQPSLAFPGVVQPSGGSLTSPAASTIAVQGVAPGDAVFFGNQAASNPSIVSNNLISVIPPSSSTPGPTDVVVETSSGGAALAPDGYTYGPHILYVQTNGGSTAGGAAIKIIGYGLSYQSSQPTVTIGGAAANITQVSGSMLISPFMLPMQFINAVSPPGSLGPADITVTTPTGSTTLKDGFYYYTQSDPAGPSALSQMVFDPLRRVLYATDDSLNQVDVISPDTNQMVGSYPTGVRPAGLALSPDNSTLLVANWQSQSVSVIDIDSGSRHDIPVNIDGQSPGTLYPLTIAASNNGKAILGLVDPSTWNSGLVAKIDLGSSQMTAEFGASSDIELHSFLGGSKIWVGWGGNGGGAARIWDAATGTYTVFPVKPFSQSDITQDGLVVEAGSDFYTSLGGNYSFASPLDLLKYLYKVNGAKLHPGGGVYFKPVASGDGSMAVELYDVQGGTLLRQIDVPGKALSTLDSLAVDDTGDRVFAATQAGIVTINFPKLPLSIGSVSPGVGSPAGGDMLTIRGSNFQSGSVVSIGGVDAVTTFMDGNTLQAVTPPGSLGPVAVQVKNPDGETYVLAAGFKYVASSPTVTATAPASIVANNGFLLTVFGTGFKPGSSIQWNGVSVSTTFLNDETLQAIITPAQVGMVAATAQITVSNPGGGVSNVQLFPITTLSSRLALLTYSVRFVSQLVGTTSDPIPVVVENTGGGILDNFSFSVTGNFAQTNNCVSGLGPKGSCTVQVTFSPTATGIAYGKMTVNSDGGTATVDIRGRGVPSGPALGSSPLTYYFGSAVIGSPTLNQSSITVYSVGPSAAAISSVTTTGDFQVAQNSCPATLSTGASCPVLLTFVPTTSGLLSGSLRVASDAGDSPMVVPLSGTGVQSLVFSPQSLDFGPVPVSSSSTKEITVQNPGSSIVGLSGIASFDPNWNVTTDCAGNIYPGTSCVITVKFAPLQAGNLSSFINAWVTLDMQPTNYQLQLKGSGTGFQLSLANGAPSSVTVQRGQTATFTLNLTNQGYTDNVAFACSGAPAQTTCTVNPSSVNLSGVMVQPVTITVPTVAASSSAVIRRLWPTWFGVGWLALVLVICAAFVMRRGFPTRRSRWARVAIAGLAVVVLLGAFSCGGGGSATGGGTRGGGGSGGSGGTTPGTYLLTITATSANTSQQTTLTLIVQ